MAGSIYAVLIVAIFAAAMNNCAALTDEKKAEIKEKLKPTIEECGKEHGITFDYLTEFKAQKKHPDDSNKCFFACVFKKIGLLDSKGLYSEEVAKQKIAQYAEESKKELAEKAAATCKSVNTQAVGDGDAGCDRAKLLFDCFFEQRELVTSALITV